ncbi:MAG TPA: YceH family protein, partial [Thermoanaerobaculia bacterium]
MTYIPELDTSRPNRPRIPRTLDPVEIRILGSLMEKQLSTPEYYPLTLNALVAACNQKSNREPVMELSETEIQRALDRLQDEKLVWKVMGGRAVRYDHNLDTVWHLKRPEKALMTLLFLRGPQTAGEMRGRSDRLQQFDTVPAVEEILRDMAAHSEPLVRQLPRRPGQKEERWTHTAGGDVEAMP